MRTPKSFKPATARAMQPLLTWCARQDARLREQAATMQLRCAACGATLAAHIGTGNRWKGCPVAVTGKAGR